MTCAATATMRLTALLLSLLSLSGASQVWIWDTTAAINGTGNHCTLAKDPLQNVYAYNNSNGTTLTKFQSNGIFVWQINFPSTVQLRNVTCSPDSSIYVTGRFSDTLVLGAFTLHAVAYQDIFLARYSQAGTLLWLNQIGSTDNDWSGDLAMSGTDVFITGGVAATVYFSGQSHVSTANNQHIFVGRYKSSGMLDTMIFADNLYTPVYGSLSYGHEIEIDHAGNILLLAQYSGSVQLGGTVFYDLGAMSLVKLDPQYVFQWMQTVSTGTNNNWNHHLRIDRYNDIVFVDHRNSASTISHIRKFDQSGAPLFIKTFPAFAAISLSAPYTNMNADVRAIELDSCGNIYFAADVTKVFFVFQNNTSKPSHRSYLVHGQLSRSGNLNWCRKDSSTLRRTGSSLAVLGLNKIYSCGYFDNTIVLNSTLNAPAWSAFHAILQGTFGLPVNVTPPANQSVCESQTISISCSTGGQVSWFTSPTALTPLWTGNTYTAPPLSAGVYTWYAEGGTCTGTSARLPITVTVNPTPMITVSSGSVCSGSAYTITASGADTYLYHPAGPVVTTTVSSSYTVTGSSAGGCSNTAVSTVSVLPLPQLTVVSGSSVICASATVTLTAGGAQSYSWNTKAGPAFIVVRPPATTIYTLTGSDLHGCVGSQQYTQTVIVCSSLAEREISGHLWYPNPSAGEIFFKGARPADIKVYNQIGQLVLTATLEGSNRKINLLHLENGLYLIELRAGQTSIVHKMVLAK